ncbi:hypothetical protein SteCoe_35597 [Stentor coeruleus]|uniref:Uncharacterized protein n=1 Tax=Stentor coeruleus TaxID=5963 RepID=A0A1R2ARY3_9CILI|nr:hypothetical protein SteCoe_35597 [Stentor coeruleus]
MEKNSSNKRTELLSELTKKHEGIRKEVEILEKHFKSALPGRNLSQSITQEANIFFNTIEKFLKKPEFSEKIRLEGKKLLDSRKKSFESSLKTMNLDFETLAVSKMLEIYKLQVKIYEMTVNLHREKQEELEQELRSLHEKIKEAENLSKSKIASPRRLQNRTIELSNNMLQIKQKNSEFVNALKGNLQQLSLFLLPNIEKSLNFLVLIQQKLPQEFAIEFSNEKAELESRFKDISEYIESFFSILEEFSDEPHFGRFSDISNDQESIHRIEAKEISLSKESSICKSRQSFFDELGKKPEMLIKVIDMELESDKECIKNLKVFICKIENERKNLEKMFNEEVGEGKLKENCEQKAVFISQYAEEALQILKKSIVSREKRMRLLQNSSSFEKNFSRDRISLSFDHSKPPSAIKLRNPLEKPLLCLRREPINFRKIIESKEDTEKIWNPECYDLFNGDNSILSLDSDSETSNYDNISKTPEIHRSFNSKKAQAPSYSTVKSFHNITQNQTFPVIKILDCSKQVPKNNLLYKKLMMIVRQMKSEIFGIKNQYIEEFGNIKSEMQKQVFGFPSMILAFQKSMTKNSQIEIEELIDSNESFRSQIEALKEAFQVEVKNINIETGEIKKLNKDLKDSLLILSNKYEIQNRFVNEIMAAVPNHASENLNKLKDYVLAIITTYKLITRIYQESNPELLYKILSEEIKVPTTHNSESILKSIEAYLNTNRNNIIESLQKKDRTLRIQLVEVGQVFEKHFKNINAITAGFLDEKIMKVQESIGKLSTFKNVVAKYMDECALELKSRGKVCDDLNEKIGSLERQVIKMKINEKELQCVISSKIIEIQDSKENFNTLQEFSEDCVRVLEKFNMELKIKREYEQFTLAMDELLEIHKEYVKLIN